MVVMIERNYLHSSRVEKMNGSPQSKSSDFSAEVNLQRHVPAGVAVVSIVKVAPESAVGQKQQECTWKASSQVFKMTSQRVL